MGITFGKGAAIVGLGITEFDPDSSDSAIELAARALKIALDDAGISRDEVDGLAIHTGVPMGADYDHLAPALGLDLRHVVQYWAHGRWITTTIQNAAFAVAADLANIVAIVTMVKFKQSLAYYGGGAFDPEGNREAGGVYGQAPAFGLTSPHPGIALAARRYIEKFGLDNAAFLPIVRSSREHAMRNPRSLLGQPFDSEAYLGEPMIMDPLRRSDCMLENDVAVVCLVAPAERAGEFKQPPVHIRGMQGMRGGREEFLFAPRGLGLAQQGLSAAPAERRPHQVFETAGVGPGDIDGVYIYDIFSPLVPFVLERFGHCPIGTATRFAAEGGIGPGGRLPVNSNGGMLSEGYACGWNSIAEIVRQVRGEAGATQLANAVNLQWATNWGDSIIFGPEA